MFNSKKFQFIYLFIFLNEARRKHRNLIPFYNTGKINCQEDLFNSGGSDIVPTCLLLFARFYNYGKTRRY